MMSQILSYRSIVGLKVIWSLKARKRRARPSSCPKEVASVCKNFPGDKKWSFCRNPGFIGSAKFFTQTSGGTVTVGSAACTLCESIVAVYDVLLMSAKSVSSEWKIMACDVGGNCPLAQLRPAIVALEKRSNFSKNFPVFPSTSRNCVTKKLILTFSP